MVLHSVYRCNPTQTLWLSEGTIALDRLLSERVVPTGATHRHLPGSVISAAANDRQIPPVVVRKKAAVWHRMNPFDLTAV